MLSEFFDIVSISSIITVAGIAINNICASARQKEDRSIKLKMSLIEDVYERYSAISKEYIELFSSFETMLFEIHEEMLYSGTDIKKQKFFMDLYELSKKAVLFATYKNKIIAAFDMQISADELAKSIVQVTKKMRTYGNTIEFITKLFVVKYYETNDIELTSRFVIAELEDLVASIDNSNNQKATKKNQCSGQQECAIKDYDRLYVDLTKKDKTMISSRIMAIITEYSNDLFCNSVVPLDDFEEQLSRSLSLLV